MTEPDLARGAGGLAGRREPGVIVARRRSRSGIRTSEPEVSKGQEGRRGRARAERHPFRLVHYSLQGNHLHALVEAEGPSELGRGMMSVGIRFARAVNRALGRRGRVLEDRYHVRELASPRQVRNALRYVLLHERRHAAKAKPSGASRGQGTRRVPIRLDPASSARWLEGWRRGIAREESPGLYGLRSAPAVSRARTWLLRTGWRRHGLLDPSDVPGTA